MESPLPPPRALESAFRQLWPGRPLRRFRRDETGWTNLVLEADGRWIFRVPRWPGPARSLTREVRLLEILGEHLTVPVPRPALVGTLDEPNGWPFLVYERLPGSPIVNPSSLRSADRDRLARFLARLLAELDRCPPGALGELGLPAGDRSSWATAYRKLERRYRRVAADRLPAPLDRDISRLFRGFFAVLEESRYRPTLIHCDLWPSHVLWNRARTGPSGVIDWEDARFGDPAFDLSALGELGPTVTRTLIARRRSPEDDSFVERLLFYRRILPLHGVLFGIETGDRSRARAHVRQLRISLRLQTRDVAPSAS
jgi:aminoglycoside 2''-phosphotransferase